MNVVNVTLTAALAVEFVVKVLILSRALNVAYPIEFELFELPALLLTKIRPFGLNRVLRAELVAFILNIVVFPVVWTAF